MNRVEITKRGITLLGLFSFFLSACSQENKANVSTQSLLAFCSQAINSNICVVQDERTWPSLETDPEVTILLLVNQFNMGGNLVYAPTANGDCGFESHGDPSQYTVSTTNGRSPNFEVVFDANKDGRATITAQEPGTQRELGEDNLIEFLCVTDATATQ